MAKNEAHYMNPAYRGMMEQGQGDPAPAGEVLGEPGKLDPAIVLYFPASEIGEEDGARCGACMMYVAARGPNIGRCTVVEGAIRGDTGVCGLYVHGKHSGPEMKGMISKEIAGYIENGPTHCGNCEYYGGVPDSGGDDESGPCEKVSGTVEFHGCCNYWEASGEAGAGKTPELREEANAAGGRNVQAKSAASRLR